MTKSSENKPLVVITGVGGAIGGVLARALRDDYTVVGLDRSDTKGEVPLILVDLTVDASVDQALTELRDAHGARIASVIHLAGYVDFKGEDHPLYHSLNVDGTRRLLDRLQRFRVEAQTRRSRSRSPALPG